MLFNNNRDRQSWEQKAVSMYSATILRIGSEVLHSTMGGMCVFCLYYAAKMPDPIMVRSLIFEAFKWGGLASIVLYSKLKYLES